MSKKEIRFGEPVTVEQLIAYLTEFEPWVEINVEGEPLSIIPDHSSLVIERWDDENGCGRYTKV